MTSDSIVYLHIFSMSLLLISIYSLVVGFFIDNTDSEKLNENEMQFRQKMANVFRLAGLVLMFLSVIISNLY